MPPQKKKKAAAKSGGRRREDSLYKTQISRLIEIGIALSAELKLDALLENCAEMQRLWKLVTNAAQRIPWGAALIIKFGRKQNDEIDYNVHLGLGSGDSGMQWPDPSGAGKYRPYSRYQR